DKPVSAILSPTWNQTFLTGVASNDCAKCHGYPPATGTHSGVTPANCRSCHTHVNNSGTGFTNPALHINGSIESSSGHTFPYPGTTHRTASNPSAPYTNCNGCHNATTGGGTYPVAVGTPPLCSACHLNMTNFTGTTPGCWDCHGSSATNGQPNGATFPNIAGSHAKHAGLTSTPNNCAICHNGFGSGNTAHGSSNRTAATQASVNIAFNATQAGASAAWTQATSTCSTTYCHSSVQGTTGTGSGTFVTTPGWGGSLTCGGCHQNMSSSASATGSHASHAQSTGTVYACSVCHGTGFTSTAAVYPPHVNNVIDLSFTVNAVGTSYSKGAAITPGSALYGTCSANLCHGASNPTWGSNTTKPRCAKCHGFRSAPWNALNGTTASSDARAGAHFNHISSAGALKFAKSFSCAECHAASIALSTNNVNAAGHFDTASPAELSFGNLAKTNALTPGYNSPAAGQCSNVYCHGNSLDKPASAVLSPTWNQTFLTGVASNDCAMCHGYPPATPVHAGMTPTDCTFCHPHVNADGTGFSDAAKHVNGTIDFSGTPHSFPYPGSAHNSNAGTSPFTSCITSGCHVQGTAASPYPVASGTPPDCRSCHGKAAPIGDPNRCDSCHGTSTNGGLPTGAAFPDIAGRHGTHSSMVCSDCHGTAGHGDPTHGDSNRTAHGDADVNVPFPAANAGFSFTRNGNGGGTCNGTCHGQSHSNESW
ncbi:MAG TPA: CxxxxCH/CxxCH domain-containing protein, partial [Geobacteraceae bacterium]|nr:CxxxxCH/CxxCH domain-containing protein [Geobacteraceae bacterium]